MLDVDAMLGAPLEYLRASLARQREKIWDGAWRYGPVLSLHEMILEPYLVTAATQLATERFYRCICESEYCQANQIEVRAWHLYWADADAKQRRGGELARNLAEAYHP